MKMNLSRVKKKILIFILAIPFLVLPFELAWGANSGDVVINEVMWAGADNEWIELYNNTDEEIILDGWRIDNTRSSSVESNTLLLNGKIEPGSYFVICETAMENCDFNLESISQTKYSLSLNDTYNKNGQLILRDANQIIIDQTPEATEDNWPAGKNDSKNKKYFSMERVNPKVSGIEPSNWKITITDKICGTSTTSSGSIYYHYGTPKAQNSQFSTAVPQPLSANAGDNDIISTTGTEITFDASASTGDIQSYSWNFGDGETATGKIVTHKYQYPGEYYVSLIISDGEKESSDLKKVTIFSSEIFISEFLPNPKGDDSGKEWIEVVNESSNVQNISGWGLGNSSEKPKFIFPSGSYLASQGLILLSSSLTKISLSNDSGSLFLFYPSGSISQEVKYENPGEDVSIARKDGEYFYTKNLTPGMKNIVSLSFKEVQSNSASQAQSLSQSSTSTSTSTQSQNQSQPQNPSEASTQNLTPNQESASFNSKVSEENEDLVLQGQTVAVPTNTLPQDVLNKNLLAEVKANQTKLILSIVCVTLCSGFFGVSLVILRRKLKNKNIGDKNIEKIEVEIEK